MTGPHDRWWTRWRHFEGVQILHVDLSPDGEREARARSLLDGEETARFRRFVARAPGRRYALCRAALRVVLADRLGCTNGDLSFGYRKHGKPFARVNGEPASIEFNLSHGTSHGLIALADRCTVGVDVEERVARRDFLGIGTIVYGPTERQFLSAVEGTERVQRFYRLWSLKEALIKALGTGFSLNPATFEVPETILRGDRSGVFRFPHAPSVLWRLKDLGEPRFAAAIAYSGSPV